ncbi:MAG: GNAT family N-acetyltransferase [Gammaproteobacteria bacterium]
MIVADTERLVLRRLTIADAEFILELLTDPGFLRFVGDKGVRTFDDAREYILKGPIESYERFGFGMYLVELRQDGTPIGICGLVKRAFLQDVDVGFAFLPQFHAKGYAIEAASAVVAYAKRALGLVRIAGITRPDNHGSIRVLEKLGLKFERMVELGENGPIDKLFVRDL